jgi:hypothetical protein
VLDGKFKVAQYGQFDGYPSGQGKTALEIMRKILKENQLERFKEKVRALSQLTDAEHKQLWIDVGADPSKDYVSLEIGNAFDQKHPELSRRTAAEILGLVMYRDIARVKLSEDFAHNSPFCEWAYVVDLDQGIFEVHEGFVKSPHSEGRFASGKCESSGYYPVRLAKSYKLDALPSADDFEADYN